MRKLLAIASAAAVALTLLGAARCAAQVGPLGNGPIPAFALVKPVVVSYQTLGVQAACTNCNFGTLALGTAATNRVMVIEVWWRGSGGNTRSISSLTVAGNAASCVESGTAFANGANICVVAVPTGTTGNVTVNFSGGVTGSTVAVLAAYGMSTTATSVFDNQTSTPFTNSVNVPAGGVAFGVVGQSASTSGQSFSWSGIAEDFDNRDAGTDQVVSGAHTVFLPAQTGLSITATYSTSTTNARMAVATFGPAP